MSDIPLMPSLPSVVMPVSTIAPAPDTPLPASAFVMVDEVSGGASNLRPLYVVRRRLEQRGLWVPLANALIGAPDKLLTLLSTENPGMVDITDPDVIAMVQLVGANPTEILA